MKRMIILLLAILVMSGCSAKQVEERLDAAGDMVEEGLDNIMNSTDATTAKPDISEETAVSIALKHADTSKDKVSGLRTDYEVDDGEGHYDVRFLLDGQEYDYEIHAKTGKIISFEKDD